MYFETHNLFTLTVFFILLRFNLINQNPWIFLMIILIATNIPDIDTHKSFIGDKLKLISKPIERFVGHRQLLHSLTFMFIISLILFLLPLTNQYILPFVIGFSCHLFLDLFTKSGLKIFWPLKLRIKGPIKTGSLTEGIFFLSLFLFLIFFLFFTYL